MKKLWIAKVLVIVPLILAAVTALTFSLWNWLVPELFHGPLITFWQALGLLLLSKILFGGFHGKRGGHMREHWRNRWENKMKSMTPEQREELRKKWKSRCGPAWNFPEEDTTATNPTT